MLGAIQGFSLLFATYALIFSGLAFSNKKLFPSVLDGIYDNTGLWFRLAVFTCVFSFTGNFLMMKAFQVTAASVAGPMLLAVLLIITIVNAMILDKVLLTLPIIASTSGALFFCCLTAWLLEAQRAAG